jgi:hypothetical protein
VGDWSDAHDPREYPRSDGEKMNASGQAVDYLYVSRHLYRSFVCPSPRRHAEPKPTPQDTTDSILKSLHLESLGRHNHRERYDDCDDGDGIRHDSPQEPVAVGHFDVLMQHIGRLWRSLNARVPANAESINVSTREVCKFESIDKINECARARQIARKYVRCVYICIEKGCFLMKQEHFTHAKGGQ